MLELPLDTLHGALADLELLRMSLAHDTASTPPNASSVAAGGSFEGWSRVNHSHADLDTPFQSGRTQDITHRLVAKHLEVDEGIRVDPESIVVTVGAQEAMLLVLRALRTDERDALLAVRPASFGLTEAARLLDMPVVPVASGPTGIDLGDLDRQLTATRKRGLRTQALYLVPNFSHPAGTRFDLATRRRLLDIAAEHELLLIEDAAHGPFHAHPGHRLPTLKALDTERVVLHIGSYARTRLPGAQVGFVVADQPVTRGGFVVGPFAEQLSLMKRTVTLDT
jgi:(S)-3,5-dihydroxyphenylglycine transaminase